MIKNSQKIFLCSCLFLLMSFLLLSQENKEEKKEISLTKIWETPPVLKTPESAVFDAKRNCLYVSNFNIRGGFVRRDDKTSDEFITKMGLDGKIQELEWITGLLNPTGMAIYADRLFIVVRDGIVKINIDDKKIEKKYPLANAFFPNDITFDNEGTAYFTDNSRKVQETTIYQLKDNAISPFLAKDRIFRANGITTNGHELIVFDFTKKSLVRIHTQSKKISKIITLPDLILMDGLQSFADNQFIVSDFAGKIYHINSAGEARTIFDTKTLVSGNRRKISTADHLYIAEKKLLLVPTFFDNRLIAFQVNF